MRKRLIMRLFKTNKMPLKSESTPLLQAASESRLSNKNDAHVVVNIEPKNPTLTGSLDTDFVMMHFLSGLDLCKLGYSSRAMANFARAFDGFTNAKLRYAIRNVLTQIPAQEIEHLRMRGFYFVNRRIPAIVAAQTTMHMPIATTQASDQAIIAFLYATSEHLAQPQESRMPITTALFYLGAALSIFFVLIGLFYPCSANISLASGNHTLACNDIKIECSTRMIGHCHDYYTAASERLVNQYVNNTDIFIRTIGAIYDFCSAAKSQYCADMSMLQNVTSRTVFSESANVDVICSKTVTLNMANIGIGVALTLIPLFIVARYICDHLSMKHIKIVLDKIDHLLWRAENIVSEKVGREEIRPALHP